MLKDIDLVDDIIALRKQLEEVKRQRDNALDVVMRLREQLDINDEIERLREALRAIEEIGEHLVWPVAEIRNIAITAQKEGE